MYLYRAVDSQGNTLEFLLSPRHDGEVAKRFFTKALAAPHVSTPRVITFDKNAAYPIAFKELKAEWIMPDSCDLRQSKYLNNLVEQDHRFIKRLVKTHLQHIATAAAINIVRVMQWSEDKPHSKTRPSSFAALKKPA